MQSALLNHLDVWTSAIETRSTAGRGSSNKLNLYGIKKLRELILELAVRGQLVPQNPDDEPASILLEKIAAEKARLIKDGKLKKQEPLPPITDDEKPFELPKGWEFLRLGEMVNVLNGRAYKKHEMLNQGTPLLRVGNLFTSNEWYYSDLELEDDKYIDNGDLIYAWSASFGPFIWDGGKVIYHYHIWKLDFFHSESVYRDYLFNYLLAATKSIKASGNGIAMIHMTKERMEKLVIPVPPLAEQHRIVAKVNELMSLCDALEQEQAANIAAHQTLVEELLAELTQKTPSPQLLSREAGDGLREDHDTSCSPSTASRERGLGGEGLSWQRIATHFDTLFTTEHSIDQLKQTILQLVVMGKLVPQDPNDEPASVLLQKIAAEKARLIKAGKIKKEKPLPAITEDEQLFELPDGWEWCRLGQTGLGSTGKTPSTNNPAYFGGVIPFIGPGQITSNGQLLEPEKFLTDMGFSESVDAQKGDVLMVCIGGSIGKSVIADKQFAFNQQINSLRPLLISSEYLHISVSCKNFQQLILENATGSATPIINRLKWERLFVPVPPLAEQHRIVAKVDELMALCDAMKAQIRMARTTQSQLADVLAGQVI